MSERTFAHLAGSYLRKDGTVAMLGRGDAEPKDAASGEVERLRGLGAFPEPLAAEQAPPPAEVPVTPEAVLDWMKSTKPNISEVAEMVGDDAALAQAALDAEGSITGGEPRTTLVEKLEAVIAAAEQAPPPGGDGDGKPSGSGS